MKKSPSPLLWLLLIPAQLAAGFMFSILGVLLDRWLFSGSGEVAKGHAVPFFTVIFPTLALFITLGVIIISIVLVVLGYAKRRRLREKEKA